MIDGFLVGVGVGVGEDDHAAVLDRKPLLPLLRQVQAIGRPERERSSEAHLHRLALQVVDAHD